MTSAVSLGQARRPLRCVIYTRKSSEHGLEQEFNSLDNQREAAEAYVKSQAHEGWRLQPDAYDDGGWSGGSLERPGLQRLLAEVRAGKVDVIVVYKVDRLTRSLSDFAKLVELFDAHGVSFVSVTQAFNTTTSMGRLTLNVLLSFAQFEREVTAERIRDKIAASKKKGLRVGGPVPLGYAVRDKKLVPDPVEAEQVRAIFQRYLELGCLSALVADLNARGVVTKVTRMRDGSQRGGRPFAKGSLAYLLHNRVYIGEIVHKGRHYPGEHTPIVPTELFEAVQAALAAKAPDERIARLNLAAPLAGLLYDAAGRRMLASTAKKGPVRYRYYASQPDPAAELSSAPAQNNNRPGHQLALASPAQLPAITRVGAPELERVVLQALAIDTDANDAVSIAQSLDMRVIRITLHPDRLSLHLRKASSADGTAAADHPAKDEATDDASEDDVGETMILPWSMQAGRKRREIIRLPNAVDGAEGAAALPRMRSETRARLLSGIAKAQAWLDDLLGGRVADTTVIARREGCSERSVRMVLNLAFLSPAVVQAAIAGTLPEAMSISALTAAPTTWSCQGDSVGASHNDESQ